MAPTFALANSTDPTGLSDGEYHFQPGQHNANIVSDDGNQLLFFDNGAKAGHKDMNSSSRLVQFDISARPAVDASCADKATDCASKIQNGTHCAGAFAAQCRKSCRLCWTAGSAKLAFAHTPGGKSPFLGGARKLANGNYLGNFGALTQPVCDSPCQRDFTATCLHARTCEVLPNGTEVWYARIGGKIGAGECHGWNAYRSERLTRVNETSFGRAMAAF